ncbi:MAG: hypothetical protein K5637_07410 [Lachnospiraceae bacterium]|nr:hypothetical protein [Lachnospiraceae bacterium]
MYYNNKRLALSIFWVILGVVLVVLCVTEVLDSNIYSGMGGALIGVGILQIIRNLKYRKDPEYREKINTEAGDERNSFIRNKSWAWTGYIVIIVQAVGVVIAVVLGQHAIQMVLSGCVCLELVVYWIAYLVLSRKY